jgi:hypothetical protein
MSFEPASRFRAAPWSIATAAVIALFALAPAAADEHRELGAHVHGWGTLNIAIEGSDLAMELQAPGADIVGFEYEAVSAQDKISVQDAAAQLARPLELFELSAGAQCSVTSASANLAGAEADTDHEATDPHLGHHAEFEASYAFKCLDPSALTALDFHYFEKFPNAEGLVVQLISQSGTHRYEIRRAAPQLDLSGVM